MAVHTKSDPLRRIRLKRPRRMRIFLPLLLGFIVLVLAAVSAGRHWIDHPEVTQTVGADQEVQAPPAPDQASAEGRDGDPANQGTGPEAPEAERGSDAPAQEQIHVVEKKVQPGETITSMLSDFLQPVDVYALNRQAKDVFPLRRIKAGQPYRLKLDSQDCLQGFEYEINDQKKLCVSTAGGGFDIRTEPIEYDVQTAVVDGQIETSLFEAVTSEGESAVLAVKLADIFAWDVDFIRDIRKGDSFRLVVEKRYRKGEFSGYGPIVGAKFTNQGQTYQAFLFTTKDGRSEYFNPQGQAMRKTFLKAPLNFTRISSGYTHRRKHPILNVVRPHLGIDYAAPRGTPVKSVADGVVIARAYERGGGNYLKIRHTNGYMTLYMHLSKFASGVRKGVRVEQGQTVAYVGSTGLSTGPHLDFRVKKNGSYINPLKIDSEPARPVPESEMARFRRAISPLQALLEGKNPLYAQTENSSESDPSGSF